MSELLKQAITAHQLNDLVTAERLYRLALNEAPDRADAHYNLGLVYGQQGKPLEAAQHLARAAEVRPDFGEAWFMLCEFADQLGQQELNLKAASEAVRLLPANPRAWLRHGIALSRRDRDEEAIEAFRHALKLDPALIKAWVNLAFSAKNLGHMDEAEAAIRNAIIVSGQSFDTREEAEEHYGFMHWRLSLLALTGDRYREGFSYFRARFKGGTDWQRMAMDRPLWRGENLAAKTILITAEQGHGDVLMMARYLPMLKSRGARVIFQVPAPLVRLFSGWPGADEIVALGAPSPSNFDFHAPIFDLPYRFDTLFETIPGKVPYLPVPAPDEKTRLLSEGKPRIGVIWAGQPDNIRGHNRSIPLEVFASIFGVENMKFFSLTRDPRAGETELLKKYPVTDLATRLDDFTDTARFMGQCDLIITCDTATAHLAGGMGKRGLDTFALRGRLALEPRARRYALVPDNASFPAEPARRLARRDRARKRGFEGGTLLMSLNEAVARHQSGDLAGAEPLYRAVLAAEPDQADAAALLGLLRGALGDHDEAIRLVQKAATRDPASPLFRFYLGTVLMNAKKLPEAIAAFREAIARQPGFAPAHYNMANALRASDDWPGAIAAYNEAIRLKPDYGEAYNNLALSLVHEKKLAEALMAAEKAVAVEPTYGEGWRTVCNIAEQVKDYPLALSAGQRCTKLMPDSHFAWFGYGVALNRLDRNEEAIEAYKKALALKPDRADIWDNLGQTYQSMMRLEEAEATFRKTLEVAGQVIAHEDTREVAEEEYGNRHWHLALIELLRGKYKEGFARYRSRFKDVGGLRRPDIRGPCGAARICKGKTIIVCDEQGFGDTLMLARYIPLLKQRGAR